MCPKVAQKPLQRITAVQDFTPISAKTFTGIFLKTREAQLNIVHITEPTPPSMDLTIPGVVEVTDPFNEQGADTEVLW